MNLITIASRGMFLQCTSHNYDYCDSPVILDTEARTECEVIERAVVVEYKPKIVDVKSEE